MTQAYLRVKRNKTVWFVECSLAETVSKFKAKLSQFINKEKEPADMKLFLAGKTPGSWTALEDTSVLEQLGISDQSSVYLAFGDDGKFEAVSVPPFDPLHDQE